MIAWLAAAALADPAALRGPPGAAVADLGAPDLSVAAPIGGGLAAAVELRTDGAAVGAAVGSRRRLTGAEGVAGLWVGGAAGVVVPTLDPTVGLTLAPWVGLARDGERGDQRLAVVLPAVLAPTGVRVPVLLEASAAARVGPVWLGGRGGLGARLDPASAPALLASGAVVLGLER